MPADINPAQAFDGGPEEDAGPHIRDAGHGFIGGPVTALRSLIGGKRNIQPAAAHRGKLSALVDHTQHSVGKLTAQHPVYDHAAHRHLAGIRLTPGFAVDQIRQKASVPLREAYLRDIAPGTVGCCLGQGNLSGLFYSSLFCL